MSQLEQLHTIIIPYPPYEAGRVMTCVSVGDIDTYQPVDFREFLSEDRAEEEFKIFSVGAIKNVLEIREEDFGEASRILTIPRF